MKTVYCDICLSCIEHFEWYSRFKNGHELLEQDPRKPHPSTSNNDKNVELMSVTLLHNL